MLATILISAIVSLITNICVIALHGWWSHYTINSDDAASMYRNMLAHMATEERDRFQRHVRTAPPIDVSREGN